jgi:hypothetical protein
MAVERASYSVELREPPYEIRDYGPTILAVVHVKGTRSDAVSSGFRILAGYIFGGNQRDGKIAMTAPVMQTADDAVTTPATDSQNGAPTGWNVQFMMPASYTMNTLPIPNDTRVHLLEQPRHRAAALTFSGFWSDSNLISHEAQLLRWIRVHELTATSAPIFAYYDPPWTPWFLRTIEVLVDIAPASQ